MRTPNILSMATSSQDDGVDQQGRPLCGRVIAHQRDCLEWQGHQGTRHAATRQG